MVRTLSTMLPLGTALPSFDLEFVQGTGGTWFSEKTFRDRISDQMLDQRPLLLMILCAHCPFVKHLEVGLTELDKKYGDAVQMLAIASNSLITHPQDGPENLLIQVQI